MRANITDLLGTMNDYMSASGDADAMDAAAEMHSAAFGSVSAYRSFVATLRTHREAAWRASQEPAGSELARTVRGRMEATVIAFDVMLDELGEGGS